MCFAVGLSLSWLLGLEFQTSVRAGFVVSTACAFLVRISNS
jgi:hypothetical protein